MSLNRERMSRAARAGEARTPCQNCCSSRAAILELARLGRRDPAGDEVKGQDRAAAHEHRGEEADPDEGDVEAGVIGDAGADPDDLAVAACRGRSACGSPAARIVGSRYGRVRGGVLRLVRADLRLVRPTLALRIAIVGHPTLRPRGGGRLIVAPGRAGTAGASSDSRRS